VAAYIVVNIEVKDSAAYEEYKARVPALIRRHGGGYLARGGNVTVAEGEWTPSLVVI
jgi:uncharacterized protein (DUF1330 family)